VSKPVAARQAPGSLGGLVGATGLLLLAVSVGLAGAGSSRHTEMAVAASLAVGTLLLLAVAWYDAVVAFGFLIFGVVFSEPALPDLVFGIVILAAALTGGGRLTLRRAPPLVVYILGAFLVLNMLAAAWAPSPGTPVFFVAITTYLMAFGLWVSAYVDSSDRARRVVGWLTIGATITAGMTLAGLFLSFPGSNVLTFASATRAKGLFDDPNVFGAFMSIPLALALSELVEPRLLRWRRPWLFLIVMLSGAAILFSFSRAAWLNAFIVVATMITLYTLRRESGRQLVAMVGVGLAATAVLIPFVVLTGSTSFLLSRAQLQTYDTARFHGQDASFELARTHVFGIGPGEYGDVVGIAAHSTYLRALGEEGVLGLALIAALFLVTLVLAWGNVVAGRTTFGISTGVLFGLWVGLLATSFFIDTLHWRHLWLIAGLIWGGATRPSTVSKRMPGDERSSRSVAACRRATLTKVPRTVAARR
jgi:O-antigen ligase